MLTMKELRQMIEDFPKREGTVNIEKDPVVHDGFPGTFNMSYAENYWLKEFGRDAQVNKNLVVHKIQPCIRINDFLNEILSNKSNLHLSNFDIGDINGVVNFISNKEYLKINEENVNSMITFLKNLGFDLSDIYVSCFDGGRLSKLKPNKFAFEFYIEPDPTIKNLKEILLEKNIILTKDKTFLTLDLACFNITPWGYRNEIFLKTEKGLIDVATLENLYLWPIKQDQKIIKIDKEGGLFSAAVVGLERLLLVKNKLQHIVECDHIFPLYNVIEKDASANNFQQIFVYTDALRTIHRIFSDTTRKDLSKKRKEKVAKFLYRILEGSEKCRIPRENIKDYLQLNAQLQDYYPELEKGIDNTVYEILDYFERRKC